MKSFLIKFSEGKIVQWHTLLQFLSGFLCACVFFECLGAFIDSCFNKIFITIIFITFLGNVKEYFDLVYRKTDYNKTDILLFVLGGTLFLIVKFINEISI